MRICFIGDARSVHTQRWVGWFARTHDVHLIRTTPGADGIDVPGFTLPTHSLLPGGRLLGSVLAVRRYVASIHAQIVHGHFINEAGWFAAASGHGAVVVSAWGSDLYRAPRESRLAAILNPWSARRAHMVTCDSADQARLLRTWGIPDERLRVVGWGVDLDAFSPRIDGSALRTSLGIPTGAPVVLSPRQWLPNSNIHVVLDAFQRLPEDVHLILKRLPSFEGTHAASVAGRVAGMERGGRVHVVEEISEAELPALYAAADCVVSLCETDGTPMSVLEAMATGLPVVAYRNSSLEEWVVPGGGQLVERLEGEDVAAALRPFLAGDQATCRRAGALNRSLVAQRGDRRREMAAMEEAYRSLVGEAP